LKCRICLVVVLALRIGHPLLAQTSAADSSAAASAFVTSFYRWYVPMAVSNHREPADAIALREKASMFSPQLYRALKADLDAQAKTTGEIVGLDSDPFLNTQDPCGDFAIGKTRRGPSTFRVEFFAVCNSKQATKPSALADGSCSKRPMGVC
jgi:hypothetical protein